MKKKKPLIFFWGEYTKSKADVIYLQQRWDVGKCQIKQLSQQLPVASQWHKRQSQVNERTGN